MVDTVVQFSAPHKLSDYVHRVGRTARAGRKGNAILILAPNECEFIRSLESKRIRYVHLFSKEMWQTEKTITNFVNSFVCFQNCTMRL